MKIRRYYGFDCDSIQGFNNGHYFDEDCIEVADQAAALESCREALEGIFGKNIDSRLVTDLGNGFEVITGHFDDEGNDLTVDEFETLNQDNEAGSFQYVYVTFEET